MAMNPLGALQLADQRKQSAWEHFIRGIDDVGNLDTYLKDRNLTDGSERPGVFGGSVWKMWTPGQATEATQEDRSPTGFEQFVPEAARQPELADIHRWAKIRGLNHDQATIDEKTARPAREEQSRLKELELATNAEIRKQEYNQRDIDQARNFYDSSFSQARAEEGSLNEKYRQAQAYKDKGLAVPENLQTEINNIYARFKHYSALADLAKQYLNEKPEGERGYKGSSYLFTGDEQGQPQTETATIKTNSAPASSSYQAIKTFAKGQRVEDTNAFDAFFDTLGLDASQKEAARNIYKNEVALNRGNTGLAYEDREAALKLKALENASAASGNANAFAKGKRRAIEDFVAENPLYSVSNAKRLATLISEYNSANPKNLIEAGVDFFTGGREAEYMQMLDILRNGFGTQNPKEQNPQEPTRKKSRFAK